MELSVRALICLSSHRVDQEQINDLPDQQQATCEEPDESRDPFAVVKTMDPEEADEAEQPEKE